LRLSSIVLVKSGEHLSSLDEQASKLFRFNEALLYPNLGEPVSKSESGELTIFLTAYGPPGKPAAPKMLLEIIQGGRTVGQFSNTLPDPDQSGRIQYASAISLARLQPGDYELRATVSDGLSNAVRTERFVIQP
jgi:hypothetical protein